MSRTYRKIPQQLFETEHSNEFIKDDNLNHVIKQSDNKHQTYVIYDGENNKHVDKQFIESPVDNRQKIKEKDEKRLNELEET